MTERIQKFISEKAQVLTNAGIERSKGEVETILCHLLNCERLDLYMRGMELITDEVRERFEAIIERRLTRYPIQYILEESWFYGRRFFVSPAVMVPTPETELLCETAIRYVQQRKIKRPRILDIGVGSGVISVTMALELAEPEIVALDISKDALAVAEKNAADLGAENQIEFRQSDFFGAVTPAELFDLILSNPPYINDTEYETLPPEVLADPKISLTSGPDGLDAVRQILIRAPEHLTPNGRLIFEIGYDQAEQVALLTETDDRYKSIAILKDYNDCDRLVILSCGGRTDAS
ncbi:MAG: peptide chain release factor N(5)-glutamine methyltransferase [candidate division Zixibacteria bacterium]|nr:peptide chain release factor N(5)-glutamine methyltransferase [candidate division Zixibacteria bacterium]MDH3935886.1 peptide chain release factor N(5)-glutamine methyltransferase [candidate division Zixibacteria bacterium]MDH4032690.1 peptide chain release factor N(5)-glutamine methyltransferase [candidate division Zixibacteria bacterium]